MPTCCVYFDVETKVILRQCNARPNECPQGPLGTTVIKFHIDECRQCEPYPRDGPSYDIDDCKEEEKHDE